MPLAPASRFLFIVSHALLVCCAASPAFPVDCLIDPTPFAARIPSSADDQELELNNGLVRRLIRLQPNAATVALDNLATKESLLRSVRSEARLVLDGKPFEIGGLVGQPIHNYLDPKWVQQLTSHPAVFHFTNRRIGRTEPRFAWQKRHEWLTGDPAWPPPGAG